MDPLQRLLRLLGIANESRGAAQAPAPPPAAPAPAPDPRTLVAPPPPEPNAAALSQEVIRLRKALQEAEQRRVVGEAQIGRNRTAERDKIELDRRSRRPRVSPREMAEETRANREALAREAAEPEPGQLPEAAELAEVDRLEAQRLNAAESARREANALAELPPPVRRAATADPAAMERLRRLARNPATSGALRLPEGARRALGAAPAPSSFVARPRRGRPQP